MSEPNNKQVDTNSPVPYNVVYTYNNFRISNGRSFNAPIELTNQQKYGKAYYSNMQGTAVKLRVKGKGIDNTILISANSSRGITWTKSGLGNQTYTITVMSNEKDELNGYFSLASSDMSFS